jgi:MtN3 and saliva related transmembrane protein
MYDDTMNAMIDSIGLIAGLLTTTAFIPQVLKIYRTKSGKDISARMFSLFSAGLVLWLIYGILLRSMPLILSNVVTLVLSLTIIVLKIRYREPPRGGRNR